MIVRDIFPLRPLHLLPATASVKFRTLPGLPPAYALHRLVTVFDISIDYQLNGNKSDKVEQTLKDAELIKQFKKLNKLPEDEKNTILKVINALMRDFNARQPYVL